MGLQYTSMRTPFYHPLGHALTRPMHVPMHVQEEQKLYVPMFGMGSAADGAIRMRWLVHLSTSDLPTVPVNRIALLVRDTWTWHELHVCHIPVSVTPVFVTFSSQHDIMMQQPLTQPCLAHIATWAGSEMGTALEVQHADQPPALHPRGVSKVPERDAPDACSLSLIP